MWITAAKNHRLTATLIFIAVTLVGVSSVFESFMAFKKEFTSPALLSTTSPVTVTAEKLSAEYLAPTFSMNCYNNKFSVPVSLFGTDLNGRGKASSNVVQLNINTAVKPGTKVLFVNKYNHGVCEIEVSSGYRLEGGEAIIDPIDIYTDTEPPSPNNGKPAPSKIKQYVTGLTPTSIAVNKVKFAIGRTTDTYVGTINVTYFVNYVKTAN